MRWAPRTLFGQIAASLFLGLLITHGIALWLLVNDRGQINAKLLAEYSAQRMAGIAVVLDAAPTNERPALARALSVEPTTLRLTLPWFSDKLDNSVDATQFAQEVRRYLKQPLAVQMLSIERGDPLLDTLHSWTGEAHQAHGQGDRRYPRTFIGQVRLSDGSVATFHHVLPMNPLDLPYRIIGWLTLLGVSVSLLTIASVRRLTRPLSTLASAAGGLARNLNQPPLAENGPQEVQQAAQAFNAMQRNLQRLIDTRAQALSAVSHDLRLPITRARLRLEAELTPATRQRLEHDLDEMDTMIGHTLDYLRAGASQESVVLVDLDALLDGIADDMEELGAQVERQGSDATQPLPARPQALRRALSNVMDNARLYGNGKFALSVADSPGDVLIRIADRGPGIAAELLDKVFEPYFRVDASRARHSGGSGLGLAIARAIVESHGGRITLDSQPGRGTTVCIALPRRAA